ncbi:MAG: NAD(P)-dependent oxidoreductase, partial [Ktedonobacterales bacterium]
MNTTNTTSHSENSKPRVGFIGLGHMGSAMAQRLLDAGYPLTVYDRTQARAQRVGQQGASVAQAPTDLAARCDVVMVCVTDDAAQQQVMFGQDGHDGVLAGIRDGAIIVDLSTVSPGASRRLY